MHYFQMGAMPVFVGATFDAKVYARETKRLGAEPIAPFAGYGGCAATTRFTDQRSSLVILMQFNPERLTDRADAINLIAHEATHAWQFIKLHIGETEPSLEFEAYHVGHIAGEVAKKFPWHRLSS